jgi:uncharacterized protein YcgI (DUF1989 family)
MDHDANMLIPDDLQTFGFTGREKFLIKVSSLSTLSPLDVQSLQALVGDESAEPFERQAAKGLLARHGKHDVNVAFANYGLRFDHPSKQINLFQNVLKMPFVSEEVSQLNQLPFL